MSNKYFFESNLSDRVRFDALIKQYACDQAQNQEHTDLSNREMINVTFRQMMKGLEVDNFQYAYVRFIDIFIDAYKRAKLNIVANEVCDIKEPVVLWDNARHKLMGVYPDGASASAYLESADLDYWEMLKSPAWTIAGASSVIDWSKHLTYDDEDIFKACHMLSTLSLGDIAPYMDDSIRKGVQLALAPCGEVDFLLAYLVAHRSHFNEEFVVN